MFSPATEKGFHAGREPANKGKKYPPEVLTPDEVRSLIEACSNRAPTGIRNRALIIAMSAVVSGLVKHWRCDPRT